MFRLKKIMIVAFALCLSVNLLAQNDKQAREILDRTAAVLKKAGGIRIAFEGNSNGILLLKGDKFYLNSRGVQSWFDGKTQWSYLEQSEEVNISTPSPEELQTINPYALLSLYKNGYTYQYIGTKTYNGKQGFEVLLTPDTKQEIASITLVVSKSYQPLFVKIIGDRQSVNEISITSFQPNQPFNDATFVFDSKKYPHAEIIDLR